MTDLAAVLPILFGVALVVVLVGGFLLDKKRREALMGFAVKRGWAYAAEDPSLAERWPGTPFERGDHRRARNVLRGTESGRPFVAFDYSFQTHSSDNKGGRRTTTHRFTVCAVQLPGYLGRVEVLPENLFTRATAAIGLREDIDLESEAFNRGFQVRARDAKLASDILPPRTMEFLLTARPPAFRIEGDWLIAWDDGRLAPTEVVRTCAILDRVLDGVPSFVWKDAGHNPG